MKVLHPLMRKKWSPSNHFLFAQLSQFIRNREFQNRIENKTQAGTFYTEEFTISQSYTFKLPHEKYYEAPVICSY